MLGSVRQGHGSQGLKFELVVLFKGCIGNDSGIGPASLRHRQMTMTSSVPQTLLRQPQTLCQNRMNQYTENQTSLGSSSSPSSRPSTCVGHVVPNIYQDVQLTAVQPSNRDRDQSKFGVSFPDLLNIAVAEAGVSIHMKVNPKGAIEGEAQMRSKRSQGNGHGTYKPAEHSISCLESLFLSTGERSGHA